jgi:hypothetical protein
VRRSAAPLTRRMPGQPLNPLDALLRRAVRQAPPGRARDWLLALLERGGTAEAHPPPTAGATTEEKERR